MRGKTAKKALALTVAGLALVPCIGVMAEGSHIAYADDVEVNTAAETLWCASDCERLVASISDELGVLVEDYNKSGDSEIEWNAQSIEYYKPVFLIEDKECGLYVDFDGNNGYAVFTDDNVIYGLTVDGDLEYLRETDSVVYYSYLDGFMYKDADGEFNRFGELDDADAVVAADDTIYPGQNSPGDDTDPAKIAEYVKARYPGYTLESQATDMVNGFRCTRQRQTSYYVEVYYNSIGVKCGCGTEGNCALNAMYNVMYDWSLRQYVYLRQYETRNINESIKSDPLYSKYSCSAFKQDGELKYRWECNNDYLGSMPVLYSNIRSYALNHGYTIEDGYSGSKIPATMNYVANTNYDNDMDVKTSSSPSVILDQLDHDVCGYLSILNSSTYGNHGVAVIGYYMYTKEIKVGSLTSVSTRIFYEIADGWRNTSRIFDPNTSAKPTLKFFYINVPRC